MRPALPIALLLALPLSATAQTVLVEDFETPLIGNYLTVFAGDSLLTAGQTWYVTQNSVDLYSAPARPEAGAFDGTQAVDLTGSPDDGSMWTSFATVPGAAYELVLHYARNDYLGLVPGQARIEILGTTVQVFAEVEHDPASLAFDQYVELQRIFVADTTSTVLRLTGLNPGIAGITVDGITVTTIEATGVGEGPISWTGGPILAVRPNPFRGSVRIEYRLEEAGEVSAEVLDVLGRRVVALAEETRGAGSHVLAWDASRGGDLPAGMYFLVLRTPEGASARKLLLLD